MYFLVPISYCYIFIEYMWFKKKGINIQNSQSELYCLKDKICISIIFFF